MRAQCCSYGRTCMEGSANKVPIVVVSVGHCSPWVRPHPAVLCHRRPVYSDTSPGAIETMPGSETHGDGRIYRTRRQLFPLPPPAGSVFVALDRSCKQSRRSPLQISEHCIFSPSYVPPAHVRIFPIVSGARDDAIRMSFGRRRTF